MLELQQTDFIINTLIWLYKMMRLWEIMFYRSLRRGSAFPS